MWTQLPPEKGHTHPTQFLAHVYCAQMSGWMTRPLGTDVDLGPGHIVLDGVPAPAKGAQQPFLFGPSLLWTRSPISATAEILLSFERRYKTGLVVVIFDFYCICQFEIYYISRES